MNREFDMPFWLRDVNEFSVVNIASDAANMPEQLGTKRKFWIKDDGGLDVLFKQSRDNTGEHWSEKLSCELAAILGIPHAHYDLASWNGAKGVVTESFVPSGGRLVHGNEILYRADGEYKSVAGYNNNYHTVKMVMKFLANKSKIKTGRILNIGPPISLDAVDSIKNAADAFVGYLMLDAWVGNTDRHHENWAICISMGEGIRLAPSYDHASSLGRIESQEKKSDILTTKDRNRSISSYCDRARSALFRDVSDRKPLSPIDAFVEAASFRPLAAKYWQGRLKKVQPELVRHILDLVPESEMSATDRLFANAILETNSSKILTMAV